MRSSSYLPSRREYLASLVGLPLALAACRSAEKLPEIPCTFAPSAVEAGHRLKQHMPPTRPDQPLEAVDIVIVGAGAAGLSAAWRLSHASGLSVRVVELEDAPGGTSRSGQKDGIQYPWGAHYLPVPAIENRSLVRLLNELKLIEAVTPEGQVLVPEQYLVREPEERIFLHGSWYEGLYPKPGASAEDVRQLERFQTEVTRWVVFRDVSGRRAFTSPVSLCSDDAEVLALDRISFAQWMQEHGFNSWRLLWYADYACRDDYGTRLQETSAWAGLFYFASRIVAPGIESAPLMTWPEGNGRLIQGMLSRLEPPCRTGQLVTQIRPIGTAEGQPMHEVLTFDRHRTKPGGYLAKRVIFCAPLFLARHLIAFDTEPTWARMFDHSPWAVAQLHLSARPKSHGFPDAWDNVLIDSPSLGYVSATHQGLRDYGPTCWTWYYPLTGPDVRQERQRLLEGSPQDWLEAALVDLGRAHPGLRSLVTRFEVMRWGHAMVRPVPGLRRHLRMAQEPVGGIHFAHTDLSGMALFEEAHDHGVRAAEEVLAALGRSEESFR